MRAPSLQGVITGEPTPPLGLTKRRGFRSTVSSLRDLAVVVYPHHRMLKHTVNKVLSLRDKTPQLSTLRK
ncbi:MAG: hypothetical protein LBU62_11435 [Bacteroidales bacterium]|nr:hypothetical protein [Bacteroidales bacterium]